MRGPVYCANCGTVGEAKTITKGSFLMELLLWIAFLVPGLIYSIWRISSRYRGCGACGSASVMPVDSPKAREALGRAQAVAGSAPGPPRPVADSCPQCGKHREGSLSFCRNCGASLA